MTPTEHRIRHRHKVPAPGRSQERGGLAVLAASVLALLTVTAWTYWPTLVSLYKNWKRDEDYSAGQLVPLVALVFLWVERKKLRQCSLKPCWWGGIVLLLLAAAGRMYGLLFMFESAERYSLVLAVAGLVLLLAGWQIFRLVRWILLFLFLMVPFPGRVHNLISGPLQNLATTGSVFLLEVFVPRVSQRGNVVMLDADTPMAVAEACSGLRMLTAFIIVAAFIAYMVKRPRWQKGIVLVLSIAIAVICNIIRIFLTGTLMLLVSVEFGHKFFHDFAGLVMMPAAVLLIFGQLWLMAKLVVSDSPPQEAQTVVRARPRPHPNSGVFLK